MKFFEFLIKRKLKRSLEDIKGIVEDIEKEVMNMMEERKEIKLESIEELAEMSKMYALYHFKYIVSSTELAYLIENAKLVISFFDRYDKEIKFLVYAYNRWFLLKSNQTVLNKPITPKEAYDIILKNCYFNIRAFEMYDKVINPEKSILELIEDKIGYDKNNVDFVEEKINEDESPF
ncbi:MAG: hypothetical protein ABIL45_04180 [candidate division WOR-3 bacterium]